ncbi:sodium:calcium antiporter, partial [bacterium]|nr:sodium:calcium antiporter [bacterium]
DAAVLLAGMAAYLVWAVRGERAADGDAAELRAAEADVLPPRLLSAAGIAASLGLGLPLLILGARLLVDGATRLALALGASETAVGLTVVAVGTSLPELTVSVIASLKRQPDVAVGNILGSNIFNVLFILGVTALVRPLPLDPRILAADRWVLLATALLLTVFLTTGRRLSRGEGAALLLGYGAYVAMGLV